MTRDEALADDEEFPILTLMVADVYRFRPDLTVEEAKRVLARMQRKYEDFYWPDSIKDYAQDLYGNPSPKSSEEE